MTDTSAEERAESLRATASELGVEGASSADLQRALGALTELDRMQGRTVERDIERARITLFIVDPMTEERDIVRWCRRGEAVAERLREQAPDRVEGHYYGALFMGLRARQQTVRAAFMLGDLEEHGRRAVELDERYDDGGPLRFMGMFLVNAPSWPAGPGDPEEGVELLEQAVELDDYPLNRLFLARAKIENGDESGACRALAAAVSAPAEGRWAVTGPRWYPEATTLAAQISCRLNPNPAFASAR